VGREFVLARSPGGPRGRAPSSMSRVVEEPRDITAEVGWHTPIAHCIGLVAPYLKLEPARTVFGNPRSAVAWSRTTTTGHGDRRLWGD
jgi:hypothetical protein